MTHHDEPDFDNGQAHAEGWGIFDLCEEGRTDPYQLQRVDEDARFASDDEAWRHVAARAAEGSTYHSAALDFLRRSSPGEYDALTRFVAAPEARP